MNREMYTLVIEDNNICKNRDGGGQEVKHGGDVYSAGERLGDALQILADSVKVSHVAQYGENY